jgi:hypothetical protein
MADEMRVVYDELLPPHAVRRAGGAPEASLVVP